LTNSGVVLGLPLLLVGGPIPHRALTLARGDAQRVLGEANATAGIGALRLSRDVAFAAAFEYTFPTK
jgi:hypothetical protein